MSATSVPEPLKMFHARSTNGMLLCFRVTSADVTMRWVKTVEPNPKRFILRRKPKPPKPRKPLRW